MAASAPDTAAGGGLALAPRDHPHDVDPGSSLAYRRCGPRASRGSPRPGMSHAWGDGAVLPPEQAPQRSEQATEQAGLLRGGNPRRRPVRGTRVMRDLLLQAGMLVLDRRQPLVAEQSRAG